MHQATQRYKLLREEQLLNDLDWVVRSAVMLDRSPPEIKADLCSRIIDANKEGEYEKWLLSLRTDPVDLLKYFDRDEQLILGKYFEHLLFFFFTFYPRYEIIESGKQLFVGGETISEIDFIVRDHLHRENIHFEVAVKYYLCYRNSSKHDMWIGPNGLDTLSKKMHKLSKQLDFSESHNKLIDDVEIDHRMGIIKGYLFQHLEGDNWPHFINEDLETGKWMYHIEMNTYLDPDYDYLILPKSCWLSFYIDPENRKMSKKEAVIECEKQLSLIRKGIMLVSLEKDSKNVIEKFMILPSHWPHL